MDAFSPGITQIKASSFDGQCEDYVNIKVIEGETSKNFKLALDLNVGNRQMLWYSDDINTAWNSQNASVVTVDILP